MTKEILPGITDPARIAVIFDLDGVLCEEFPVLPLPGGKPNYAELDKLYPMAFPIHQNVLLAQRCAKEGLRVFILTARHERVRPQTERWLAHNRVLYSELFMRPGGHLAPPAALKEKMLERLLERGVPGDGAEILFDMDDDPAVCDMYASRGINTFRRVTEYL